MAIKLSVEDLNVVSFAVSGPDGDDALESSMGPTLYGCTCGCGTYDRCPSDGPNCTLDCVEPSNATDWIACCG